MLPPTALTRLAGFIAILAVASTAAYALGQYPELPDILPVRFGRGGFPIGWQYKTITRVLMPVYVQAALLLVLGAVAALVLSRPHGDHDRDAPDVRTAAVAAEAIALIAAVWIVFQAYAAVALVRMWQAGHDGLGPIYTVFELTGVVISVVIFARAQLLFGTPGARPFIPEHWRFGQLYRNAHDPALFVPTRDGRRWTLNFGRPVAAALMGVILGAGVLAPLAILTLLLR